MKSCNTNRNASVLAALQALSFLIMSLLIFDTLKLRAQPIKVSLHAEQESKLREKVRQIYTAQLGIREKGYNAGESVEKYLRYVKLSKGNPWCAAFVCWVFGEAGVDNPRTGWSPALFPDSRVIWGRGESRIKNQESGFSQRVIKGEQGIRSKEQEGVVRIKNQEPRLPPGVPNGEQGTRSKDQGLPQSESKGYAFSLTTNNQQLPTSNTPGTGDIFGLFFLEKGRIAHVGFVDQWDGTWMISVEGNTNVAGSREGDGVYRKRRLVRSVYQVARYINP